ncbi:hypothetical protein PGTUg99_010188 [Puccinia graminis f. sp. tritici]|uniref:Uncharacterized protein n=1 Tax=Puccinia graminis f. sp. tritici TaxID=56615 RepID=A0A5B0M9L3_PUCGR|nr:hypothetical protein PGTUg99_010188 [Puccinia graminis f. sp. tritici]
MLELGYRSNNAPVLAPGNFQAWYPIVTPPGYQHQGFQLPPSPYAPPLSASGGQQAGKRADSYRPDYRQRPPTQTSRQHGQTSANSADVPNPPDPPEPDQSQSTHGYYRPPSPILESTLRMIEIGVFDEGLQDGVIPNFRQITLDDGDEPVLDTGATHHLTGNRRRFLYHRGWGPLFSDPEWANRNS